MRREEALPIANFLIEYLAPACTRIEVAGSIRREKPEVGDIEIVAIPDLHQPRPAFGHPIVATQLDGHLSCLELGDDERIQIHTTKNGPKFKQFWVSRDCGQSWAIKVDLFLVTPPADWGVIDVIRTGPAEFSHWIVTQKFLGGGLPSGYMVKDGMVQRSDGEYIPCPEEIDFLRFCGLDWIEPKDRKPLWRPFTRSVHIHQAIKN
jgi:DNA polymerase/3'-5' exonuclease PolX